MLTRPQPGGIGRDTSVLKTVHRDRDGVLAVAALVASPGTVAVGSVALDVVRRVPRCVMTTRPQAGGIGRDTSVLKTVHRERGGALAVGALVARPGVLAVGDVIAPA